MVPGPQTLSSVLRDGLDKIEAAHAKGCALELATPHCRLRLRCGDPMTVTSEHGCSGPEAIPLWYAHTLAETGRAVRYMSAYDPVDIAARLLCDAAGLEAGDVRLGTLGEWQLARLTAAVSELSSRRLVLVAPEHARLTLGTEVTVVDELSGIELQQLWEPLTATGATAVRFESTAEANALIVTGAGHLRGPLGLADRVTHGPVTLRYIGPIQRQLALW